MKKIKNPEAYIKKLKNRITRLKIWHQDAESACRDLRGKRVWSWDRSDPYQITNTHTHFPEFEAGDQVILIGRVRSRKTSFDPRCQNKHAETVLEFTHCQKTNGH